MSATPPTNNPRSLGAIQNQIEAGRSKISVAAEKLRDFHDDSLIESARSDLIDASTKMATALRKIERALSAARSEEPEKQAQQTGTPTKRQDIESECLKVIAAARLTHGDDICRPLGISPTADPGITMLEMFQQYKKGSLIGKPVDFKDEGDKLIVEFLDHLKAKVEMAAKQLGEPIPSLTGWTKSRRGSGARTTDSRLEKGRS